MTASAMPRRAAWVIGFCVTFLIGAAAGVTTAYFVWRPHGEGALTRAIVRKCGVREAPRLTEQTCMEAVDDALTAFFVSYYGGETPPWLAHDPLAKRLPSTTDLNGSSVR